MMQIDAGRALFAHYLQLLRFATPLNRSIMLGSPNRWFSDISPFVDATGGAEQRLPARVSDDPAGAGGTLPRHPGGHSPVSRHWGRPAAAGEGGSLAPPRMHRKAQGERQCCGIRIRDVCPGSEFFPSRIPDPNFFHPWSALKNSSILTQKNVSKLSEIWSGFFIPDPDFLLIPDPGVKKAPDPGSGSATLVRGMRIVP